MENSSSEMLDFDCGKAYISTCQAGKRKYPRKAVYEMVTIYDKDFGISHEACLLSNGIDFLIDVMAGCGVEFSSEIDPCNDFELSHDDVMWWLRWIDREQKILDYVEEHGEEAENVVCQLATDYGYDLEVLQDKTEEVFGLN